jgi:dienelactone hydrolase
MAPMHATTSPTPNRRPVPAWHPALRLGAAVVATALLAACGNASAPLAAGNPGSILAPRSAALDAALPMPDVSAYATRYLQWDDTTRQRPVLAKLYLPTAVAPGQRVPLVVFSHGIGGSREGYSYLGKHWAANGYASLHLQHVGSDRSLWGGNPLALVSRLQAAATDAEAIDRVRDLRFALDQVLGSAELAARLDPERIVAAGHSYGANTTLLAAGARVERAGGAVALGDPRIKAAVVISAPPFYGQGDPAAILRPIAIPTLHITSTGDEIRIPGYYSAPGDRTAVYEATGGAVKALAVFKDGSHSMFTDRLRTGGDELNPKVKAATRDLALAFFSTVFDGRAEAFTDWPQRHAPLLARFEQKF